MSSGMSRKPCGRSRAVVGLWSQRECTIPKQQVSERSQSDWLKILREGGGGGVVVQWCPFSGENVN